MGRLLVVEASDRVMVLAPHPDDESLATGGLLLRSRAAGAARRVVFLTDGDNNPWAQRAAERRWRVTAADRVRWGERRRGEVLAAIAHLGLSARSVRFMRHPDQGLTEILMSGGSEVLDALALEFERWRPTILAAPALDDRHPDHSALAVMVRIALGRMDPRVRPPRVIGYAVHARRDAEPGPAAQIDLALEAHERERKRRAIECHATQLRLRRAELLAYAREREPFRIDDDSCAIEASHPVRAAALDGEMLRAVIVPPARLGLGPRALLVACEACDGSVARLSLDLGRRPAARATHGGGPNGTPAFETARGAGGVLHVGLRLGIAPPYAGVFLKLERPAERRLGLFDRAGWREVPGGIAPPAAAPAAGRDGDALAAATAAAAAAAMIVPLS
jgi:LmbE family N-acetylglucosaminyl deacetylase